MSKPAARLSDKDACPKPGHGVNPTVTGSPSVIINGLPALRVGDSSACGDTVTEGIGSILVDGQPIAFLGSATAHGGSIISGSGDVLVGTQHSPAPFVAPLPVAVGFSCQLQLSAANGQPYSSLPYQAVLADGSVHTGVTDLAGATQPIRSATQMAVASLRLLPPAIATACCARHDPAQGQGISLPVSGVQTSKAQPQGATLVPVQKDDKSRPLTSGELSMARSLFKDSVDYARVRVHNEEYLPFGLQPDNTAMTPNGEMYFNPDFYKADFSVDARDRHWFMHEMVHVWQHQLGYWVRLHGMLLHPGTLWGLLGDPYVYEFKAGSKLQDFNMEQQGDILADYFSWSTGNSVMSESGRNVRSLAEFEAVLSDFLRNPKDASLLP